MKKLAIVVFAAAALSAVPVDAGGGPLGPTALEGQGLFGYLACGACIGSGVALSATGLGAFYAALMAAGDGALADSCLSACTL